MKSRPLLSQSIKPLNLFNPLFMTDIIKYEKQIVIECFDEKLYFTPESNYQALKLALKTDRFVELNGELVNVSTIKKVYLTDAESGLNEYQKRSLQTRKKNFKDNLGRDPNQAEIMKMILKIKSKQEESADKNISQDRILHFITDEEIEEKTGQSMEEYKTSMDKLKQRLSQKSSETII